MTDELVVEVMFLTGRYVATAHDRRDLAEWPPHPARLYSALVAEWAAAGESAEERRVLEALERLPAPVVHASAATPWSVLDHFVPVNDTTVLFDQSRAYGQVGRALADLDGAVDDKTLYRATKKLHEARDVASRVSRVGSTNPRTAAALFDRPKQARTFPSVTPDATAISFVYPQAALSERDRALINDMLGRVTRLGHSSSMVSCRVSRTPAVDRRYVPDAFGDRSLRWVGEGQLEALEAAHQRHRGTLPRSLPAVNQRYRVDDGQPQRQSVERAATAGDWIALQFVSGDRSLPMHSTVGVASAVRGALLSHADDVVSERFSGHRRDGRRTDLSHVAVVPLPNVHHQHADGRILGVALAMPAGLDGPARTELYDELARATGRWLGGPDGVGELRLGRAGVHQVELAAAIDQGGVRTVQRSTWAGRAATWVSVTPIALPFHPSRRNRRTGGGFWDRVHDGIGRSCEHVDLPRPVAVFATPQPLIAGSSPSARFPNFEQPDRQHDGRLIRRHLVHARIQFDTPVAGPLMLGSGRYLGLGLMRPMSDSEAGPWPS